MKNEVVNFSLLNVCHNYLLIPRTTQAVGLSKNFGEGKFFKVGVILIPTLVDRRFVPSSLLFLPRPSSFCSGLEGFGLDLSRRYVIYNLITLAYTLAYWIQLKNKYKETILSLNNLPRAQSYFNQQVLPNDSKMYTDQQSQCFHT